MSERGKKRQKRDDNSFNPGDKLVNDENLCPWTWMKSARGGGALTYNQTNN